TPSGVTVPTSLPSARTRWTSRSSRVRASAHARGPTPASRAVPPQRTAYSPERKSFPGAERQISIASGLDEPGVAAEAAAHHVPRARLAGDPLHLALVRGEREEDRIRARVEGEPHRDSAAARGRQREDEPQGGRQEVAERRVGSERRGVHSP